MRKLATVVFVILTAILFFFNPPKPISKEGRIEKAYACTAGGQPCGSSGECCGNLYCSTVTGNCESQGPGLTTPQCDVRFTSPAVVGAQINLSVDVGDNGEVFFDSVRPAFSGSCNSLVGYCSSGNVCSKYESQGMCTNVCGRVYLYANRPGLCTVKVGVHNNAGASTCQASVNVTCPSLVRLSGNFYGNLSSVCVDVYDNTTNSKLVGSYCGQTSWRSTSLASGRKYQVIPRQIANYSVSPSSRQTGVTCGDENGLNFVYKSLGQHKECVNNACALVEGQGADRCQNRNDCAHYACSGESCVLVSGGGQDICTSNSQCVTVTHRECVGQACRVVNGVGSDLCTTDSQCLSTSPSSSYFQTFNGDVTAKRILEDENIPSLAISAGVGAPVEAGVISGSPARLPSVGDFSENGSGTGFNLTPYVYAATLPTYESLLENTLKNGGFSAVSQLPSCPGGKFESAPYRFWCYTSSGPGNFQTLINAANGLPVDPDIEFDIFVPDPSHVGGKTINNPININRKMLVYVKGDASYGLRLKGNVQVSSGNTSGFLVIVDGRVQVDQNVTRLDGFYVFGGSYTDGVSTERIEGIGSLIGTGVSAFSFPEGLVRSYPTVQGAAESWTYDGRYVSLYRGVLGRPKFYWKELPGR